MRGGETDVVVGSRYLERPGLDEGLSPFRKFGSRIATRLGRRALEVEVTDPMSGFFMIRREVIDQVADQLEPSGFKILFDILASQPPPPRVKEIPYAFQAREAGESKLDSRVVLEYAGLVAAKLSGGMISPRLRVLRPGGPQRGGGAHGRAAGDPGAVLHPRPGDRGVTAMTSNYLVNNAVTYRDRRRRGWRLLDRLAALRLDLRRGPGGQCGGGLGAARPRHAEAARRARRRRLRRGLELCQHLPRRLEPRRDLGMAPRTALVAVIAATARRAADRGRRCIPLTEDEAYYRLWSMKPAFGYFDHPPMIAWLIWLGRHIAGDGPLGVRLVPILTTALISLSPSTWPGCSALASASRRGRRSG